MNQMVFNGDVLMIKEMVLENVTNGACLNGGPDPIVMIILGFVIGAWVVFALSNTPIIQHILNGLFDDASESSETNADYKVALNFLESLTEEERNSLLEKLRRKN